MCVRVLILLLIHTNFSFLSAASDLVEIGANDMLHEVGAK